MSTPQMLYLGMAVAGFAVFMVTLMAVWIGTRGWARPEVEAASSQPAEHEHERLAA